MQTVTKKRYNRKQAIASEPQWSKFQNDIFNWIETGSGNLRVGATAGSGKTSVLAGIVNRLPPDSKVAVLAFNKHSVETLKERLPTRITVATANSMGQSILCGYFREKGAVKVEGNKYRKISRRMVQSLDLKDVLQDKDQEKQLRSELTSFLNQLIACCQSTLTDPTVENLKYLTSYYGINAPVCGDRVIPFVAKALKEGEAIATNHQIIDYKDQLWLLHKWDLYPAQKDWVLLDEIQDANPAQLSLYKKMIAPNGRAIAVGDEFQAIQGFAFAAPEMWGKIQSELKAETLPLSVCYRCPTSHLDLARAIVPDIQPRPNAIVGEVRVLHPSKVKEEVKPGDLVICRTTAPLVQLCLKLMLSGIQVMVRGRDVGAQLVSLVEESGCDYFRFLESFSHHCQSKIQELRDRDEDDLADNISDRQSAVAACYEEFGKQCKSLQEFTKRISELFTDESTPIVLCTIHKAKGDEAERVFLLGSNGLPKLGKATQEWQEQQEWNLLYVALTRAKQSLFLVPLPPNKNVDASSILDALCRHPYGGLELSPVAYIESSTIAPTPLTPSQPSLLPSSLEKLLEREESKAIAPVSTSLEGALFQVGDLVTNDRGWNGCVERVQVGQYEGGFYYWVWWQEREHHAEALVRKQPIIGHLASQISRVQK